MSVEAGRLDLEVEKNAFSFRPFLLSEELGGHVVLGPGNEKSFLVGDTTEPGVVDVGLVEAVDAVRGDRNIFFRNGNFVPLAVRDGEKNGKFAGVVELVMELDGPLTLSELGPRERGEAEVDDRGVQRVERVLDRKSVV